MLANIINVLMSNIVVMFTSVINTLIIPKLLSIDGYAEYQTFMLYISYVGLLTLGFHSGLFVKYGGCNKNTIEKSQLKSELNLVLFSQMVISAVVMLVAFILKNKFLLFVVLCILPSNFVSVYKYLYQAWNEFKKYSIVNVVQSLGFSGLVLVLGLILHRITSIEVITVYIIINFLCFIWIFVSYCHMIRGVKGAPVFSKENYRIFQIGFLLMLGGAAQVVFNSVDKYYIKFFFTSYEFSMYCFSVTLLNVMNVFISAIAQPMYLQLAEHIEDYAERKKYKEIMLCFGGLSGCAYYAVAIIVQHFIREYTDSLKVVAILFAIFPAVAVINCLYVNLYKATNQIKRYLITLVIIIGCSVFLDAVAVAVSGNYLAITFATTVCYYIWLFISSRHFKGLILQMRDYVYLIGFFIIYFTITNIGINVWAGFCLYFLLILGWDAIVYYKSVGTILKYCLKKWNTH